MTANGMTPNSMAPNGMTANGTRRIAMISEHASPLGLLGGTDAGGQNIYVAQIARRLAARGYLVDIFTRRDRPDLPEVLPWAPGCRVVHVAAGPPRFIRKEDLLPHMDEFTANLVARISAEPQPYDLMHANFWMSALVAAEVKERLGIPFVVTFHALGKVRRQYQREQDAFPDERFAIEERVVAAADRIIAECPQDEVDLISLYAAEPGRITMVPCGFDPAECHRVPRDEARERLGLPAGAPVILQLGRLVPRKGVDNVVRALRGIREHHPDAVLVVVGGESDQPDPTVTPEIGRLEAIAEAEGVADACIFAGRADREEIRYYYSAADVFVTTPWYEPFGITPVEAMACGTPVVGARVGGIQYTVCDGETGFLVEPRDPRGLAERICLLLCNEPLRQKMGENGMRRVRDLFTWDAVGDSVAALYEEVLRETRAGHPDGPVHRELIARSFDDLIETLAESRRRLTSDILHMTKVLGQCFRSGGKVLVCGNGGSAAEAQHFAAELVGRFKIASRRGLPVVALNTDGSLITAWSNDMGYESVFARQVEALGAPGDVLLGISTTGRSRNIVCAFEAARRHGMQTLALLGGDGGDLLRLAGSALVVPAADTPRVQEVHAILIHLLCELVEREMAAGAPARSLEATW